MYVLVIVHEDGEQTYVGPFVNERIANEYANNYKTEELIKFEIHPITVPVNGK